MNGFKYTKDSDNIVTVTMDMEGSTNAMNEIFLDGLSRTMDRLEKELDEISGVIITSAKKEFLAGADLTKVIDFEEGDKETFFKFLQDFKAISRRLETLGKPVVAAINGTALGGGCELALACHHRIALNSRKIEIGMPESMLGLLPGGGGIVRSIRLLGFAAALPLLLEGKRLKPEKALVVGLIHDIAETEEELYIKAVDWIKANPEATQPWDNEGYKIPGGDMTNPQVVQMAQAAPGMLKKKTKGLMPALEVILDVAVHSLRVDFETALRIESRGLVKLIQTPEAKNMINTFFFNLKDVRSFRPEGVEKSIVTKLGVIGGGMMGQGISYVSAKKGIDVILVDVDLEAAEKGKAYSEKLLNKALGKGRITEEKKTEILSRIKPTSNSQDLEGCDLIIETVFEDLDLKHRIVENNEHYLKQNGVFASNTSTLPI
ncbi:enoyl-CoA hydratase/isomerase family protein, partial [bacterium]|nr:enoyl-CoA hydratase/isomerase family protein [bacterium]